MIDEESNKINIYYIVTCKLYRIYCRGLVEGEGDDSLFIFFTSSILTPTLFMTMTNVTRVRKQKKLTRFIQNYK